MTETWMVLDRLFSQGGAMNRLWGNKYNYLRAARRMPAVCRPRQGPPPAGPAIFDSSAGLSWPGMTHRGSQKNAKEEERNAMNQPDRPNPSGLPPVQLYRKDRYVERSEEKPIQEAVNLLLSTGLTRSPVVFYFWGIAGLGKTFLLKHLQDVSRPGILPLYYSFNWQQADLLSDLTSKLAGQAVDGQVLAAPTTPSASEGDAGMSSVERFRALAQRLVEHARGTSGPALLLLLDNIDLPFEENENKRCRETWQVIETQLVEPLITRRCIVVSTGKTKIAAWSRYEIQHRLNEEREQLLSTFNDTQVTKQIEKAGYRLSQDHTPAIIHYSCGIPRLVDLLADFYAGRAGDLEKPAQDKNTNEWKQKMDQLLTGYKNELITDQKVRDDLNILYPLRSLIVETLRYMLPKRDADLENHPDLFFLSYIRDLDRRTEIISYDSTRRAYIILPAVRKMIDQHALLRYHSHPQDSSFYELHNTAADMYWEWAKDTPKVSEAYLLEIIFHRAEQYQADGDDVKLHIALKEVTDFASRNLPARRLGILQESFAKDDEISKLLPHDQWNKIQRALQAESAPFVSPAA